MSSHQDVHDPPPKDRRSWKNMMRALCGNVSKYPSHVWFILGNELCERFAYYGMRAVLVIYFVEYIGFSVADSISYYHLFITMCYIAPLLGGYLSDAHLGKYRVILLLSVVYCIGLAVMSITAVKGVTGYPPHWWGVLVGLLLVAFGTGGIKPCVSSFGGDQFMNQSDGAGDNDAVSGFFHIFYFAINIGSLVSMILTPLLRSYASFEVAFLVPTILMLVAVLAFWMGRNRYHKVPPAGSPIALVFGVVWTAMREWARSKAGRPHGTPGGPSDTIDMLTSVSAGGAGAGAGAKVEAGGQVAGTGGGVDDTHGNEGKTATTDTELAETPGLLDRARIRYSARDVSDVRAALSALKIFIPLPIFWSLYDQQGSRWVLQAKDMDRTMGAYVMPEEQMQAVNALFILLMIPIYERGVYPFLRKIGIPMTQLRRLASGMVLAGLAFVAAGLLQLEMDRQGVGKVNVWWQVPQYIILTCGELMTSITGLEFAYSQAPVSMKSVIMAFFLLTTALGDVIVSVTAQISIFEDGGPAYDFLFFAGLMVVFAVIFSLIARTVQEKAQFGGYANLDEGAETEAEAEVEAEALDVNVNVEGSGANQRERVASDDADLTIGVV